MRDPNNPQPWTDADEAELRMRIRVEYRRQLAEMKLSMCSGKVGFDDVKQAREVVNRRGHGHADVYRCRWCNRWHLGTSQERVTKKINHGLIERQRIREIEAEIGGRQYRRNGGGRRVVPT